MTRLASILLLLCGSALAQIVAPPPPFRITLTWDAQPDPVRVHYGDASGSYAFTIDVSGTNRITIPIPDDHPTYFALTSYNLAAESDYSAEVSWSPPTALTNVIVTVSLPLLTSTDLMNWQATNVVLFALTNPPGNRFWKSGQLQISSTHF